MGTYEGTLASYNFETSEWNSYDKSGEGPWSGGEICGGSKIFSIAVYDNKLIVGSGSNNESGRIASFDGTHWKNYDGSGSGTGPCDDSIALGIAGPIAMIVHGNYLVIAGGGNNSVIASYDGSNWKNYDGTGSGTGPYNDGSTDPILGDDGQVIYMLGSFDGDLIVGGDVGRIASWDGSAWKYWNGTGSGTGPYNSGTCFNITAGNYNEDPDWSSCWKAVTYNGNLIICDDYLGRVASWDGTKWNSARGGVSENTEITCPADVGGSLGGKYWTLHSTTTNYYVWYNTGSSTDPAPGGTGIPVAISPNATATQVATATAGEIGDAGGGTTFLAFFSGAVVTVAVLTIGPVTDAANVDAGVTINVIVQGSVNSGTGPYNDGTVLGGETINAMVVLGPNLILSGTSGYVGSLDGANWKNWDGSGSGTGPYNDGTCVGSSNIPDSAAYVTGIFFPAHKLGFVGSERLACWENGTWYNYNT